MKNVFVFFKIFNFFWIFENLQKLTFRGEKVLQGTKLKTKQKKS